MKTAVEWLIDEIRKLSHNENHHLGMGDIRISQGMLDELEEQAKKMEKKQDRAVYKRGQRHKKPLKDSNPITKYLKQQ